MIPQCDWLARRTPGDEIEPGAQVGWAHTVLKRYRTVEGLAR